MNHEQYLEGIRAACTHLKQGVYVLGSQVVLENFPEGVIPPRARASLELDLMAIDPSDAGFVADQLSVFFGQDSFFDAAKGFHLDGIDYSTCVLPQWWESRSIPRDVDTSVGTFQCYTAEVHDVAVAKLSANREKDRERFSALLNANLIKFDTIVERVSELEDEHDRWRVSELLSSYESHSGRTT